MNKPVCYSLNPSVSLDSGRIRAAGIRIIIIFAKRSPDYRREKYGSSWMVFLSLVGWFPMEGFEYFLNPACRAGKPQKRKYFYLITFYIHSTVLQIFVQQCIFVSCIYGLCS
jgi:hypothetical protein